MGKNEDWGPPVAGFGGRETPGNYFPDAAPSTALVPAGDERPTFTAEDLALIDPGGSMLDDEDRARYKKLLAGGLMTPEDLAKHYGLTPAELEALQAPPPSLKTVEKQLAEIATLRKTDSRTYWKSEDIQAKERRLLALREKLKAAPEESEGSAIAPTDGAEIPAALREAWERQGGFEANLKRAQGTVQAMLDGMEPEEQATFMTSFDGLPEGARTAAYAYLAAGGGHFGSAKDADLKEFAETPEGTELIAEWGSKAARHVATIKGRLRLMREAMDAADWQAAEAWLDGLTAPQAKGIWRALVK